MRYLVRFVATYPNFRIPELISVAQIYGQSEQDLDLQPAISSVSVDLYQDDVPSLEHGNTLSSAPSTIESSYGPAIHMYASFRDDQQATQVARRCTLVKCITKLIAHGISYSAALQDAMETFSIVQKISDSTSQPISDVTSHGPFQKNVADIKAFLSSDLPWAIKMDVFGAKITKQEQVDRMECFRPFLENMKAKIDLEDQQRTVWIFEDRNPQRSAIGPNQHPRQILLAYHVSYGFEKVEDQFCLSNRCYIGTTTMSPRLAFIMANLALVKPISDQLSSFGKLTSQSILDPFCGTAGCLVPCAYFSDNKAFMLGLDLDDKVLYGRKNGTLNRKGQVLFPCPINNDFCVPVNNFKQYNFSHPDFVKMDVSQNIQNLFRATWQWDVILCDPPYGIREASRAAKRNVEINLDSNHQNTNKAYQRMRIDDTILYLMDFAASCMIIGGRCVFWLATSREKYSPDDIPNHPCLALLHNCEDILSEKHSRRLLVFEKRRQPQFKNDVSSSARGVRGHDDLSALVFNDPDRVETRPRRKGWHQRQDNVEL